MNDKHKKDFDLRNVKNGQIVVLEDIYSEFEKQLVFFQVERVLTASNQRYKNVTLSLLNSKSLENKEIPIVEDKLEVVHGRLDLNTNFLTIRFSGMIAIARKYEVKNND